MTDELRAELGQVLLEAGAEWTDETPQSLDLDRWTACVRERLLDRWYRFAPFGVTSRADLRRARVTARAFGDELQTTIDVSDTVLVRPG